jgi:sigma-B regulation protein RsbU (phosphoserine phosphatase)
MMQDNSPGVSLEEILGSEEVSGFLETLSALVRMPFVLHGPEGRALATFSGNGFVCDAALPDRNHGKTGTCPCEARRREHEEYGLVQEIRLRDWRLGEIRSCLKNQPDTGRARQSIQLAAGWINDRINTEYNINSLSGEILNKYEELNLLYELSEEMASVFNTREICEIVLRKALNVIGAEKASILLWDPDSEGLRVMASVGLPEETGDDLEADYEEGVCGYVFRTGKPLLVDDLANLPEDISPGKGAYRTDSFLSVPLLISPLKVKEKVIGLINLADKPGERAYHAGDLKLVSAISSEAALSIYSSILIRDLKENERIQKEMEIAETVQRNLLPRKAPDIPGVEFAGHCVPAKKVGGDYFDFFPDPEGNVGIVVADVSGHSISSGIMMAITRGLLQSEAIQNKRPSRLLQDVNRILFNDLVSSELFITMAYFLYSPEGRRLAYANGGHNPPVLFRAGSDEPQLLDAEGMAIGFLPDVEFEEKGWELAPGDLLVAYTDGLVEAESGQGTPFGMERLIDCIKRDRHKPAAEILQGLLQAAWAHIGGEDPQDAQQDDMTLVVLKAKP